MEYEGGYEPKDGFVPDAETARKIAEAVWVPIYGQKQIDLEKPFIVTLEGDVWSVEGDYPKEKNAVGGAAIIRIRKKDGKILYLTHTV
jgi:hypothetical protein